MSDWDFPIMRSDDPRFHDPRYQRRIVATHRPIPFVENMHDVTLECGHAPLVFCTPDPKVGDMLFCPTCESTNAS
jgi:hypothetical protein